MGRSRSHRVRERQSLDCTEPSLWPADRFPQPGSRWPAAPSPGQAVGAQEAQAESPKTQDG